MGRFRSVTRQAVFAAVLMALVVPTGLGGRQQAPWYGVWQLDQPAPTSRFEQRPYRKVTSTIEPWQDGLKVSYDMVRARGGITHMEWTGRFDGRDYPVAGIDYFLTNAYRRIDDRSYEIIIKVDGKVAANAIA